MLPSQMCIEIVFAGEIGITLRTAILGIAARLVYGQMMPSQVALSGKRLSTLVTVESECLGPIPTSMEIPIAPKLHMATKLRM